MSKPAALLRMQYISAEYYVQAGCKSGLEHDSWHSLITYPLLKSRKEKKQTKKQPNMQTVGNIQGNTVSVQ